MPAAAVNAAPQDATDTLYKDLMKLDDLRKRGILTQEEFQAQKKKLLEKSNWEAPALLGVRLRKVPSNK